MIADLSALHRPFLQLIASTILPRPTGGGGGGGSHAAGASARGTSNGVHGASGNGIAAAAPLAAAGGGSGARKSHKKGGGGAGTGAASSGGGASKASRLVGAAKLSHERALARKAAAEAAVAAAATGVGGGLEDGGSGGAGGGGCEGTEVLEAIDLCASDSGGECCSQKLWVGAWMWGGVLQLCVYVCVDGVRELPCCVLQRPTHSRIPSCCRCLIPCATHPSMLSSEHRRIDDDSDRGRAGGRQRRAHGRRQWGCAAHRRRCTGGGLPSGRNAVKVLSCCHIIRPRSICCRCTSPAAGHAVVAPCAAAAPGRRPAPAPGAEPCRLRGDGQRGRHVGPPAAAPAPASAAAAAAGTGAAAVAWGGGAERCQPGAAALAAKGRDRAAAGTAGGQPTQLNGSDSRRGQARSACGGQGKAAAAGGGGA